MELENIPVDVQAEELLDELAEALGEMVGMTCKAMSFLWLEHSRKKRAKLGVDAEFPDVSEVPGYVDRSSSWQTKYKALAGWRHAVVWQRLHDDELPKTLADWNPTDDNVETEVLRYPTDSREAMRRVYFEPFPDNEPPYSWASRSSPQTKAGESATELRRESMRGCWASLHLLKEIWSQVWHVAEGGDPREVFLQLGMYGTLSDVLKFDDRRKKAEDGEGPAWMARFEWQKPKEPNPPREPLNFGDD